MKYIVQYNKQAKKWYPRSLNSGKIVSTEEICEEVSDSTVSAADVLAVLRSLRAAMTRHLCAGDKVKLDNIGTFYLVADASGNGVAKEEDVTPNLINRVNVRFAAQKVSGLAGQKNIPALAAGTIRWEKASASTITSTSGGSTEEGGGNGGGQQTGGDDNQGGGQQTGGGIGNMTITRAQSENHQIGDSVTSYSGGLTIQGTNMTGTWKAVNTGTNAKTAATSVTATEVQFSGLAAGSYNITFNGTNVLSLTVVNDD